MFVKEGGFTDADEESLVRFAAQAAAAIANARAHGEDGVQPADTAEPPGPSGQPAHVARRREPWRRTGETARSRR